MKRDTRLRFAVYGAILLIASVACIFASQSPVEFENVEELRYYENKADSPARWDVNATFNKGDIICGLMLPRHTEWVMSPLEAASFEEPYGYIPLRHMFVWLDLYNESGQRIIRVELVLVNDPNHPDPSKRRTLFVYNMTYSYGNTTKYHRVETVPGSNWIILTPEGAPSNGTYALKILTMPPKDAPPVRIALGKLNTTYRYVYSSLLPVGVVLLFGGVFLAAVAVYPKFLQKITVRNRRFRKIRKK